jgi:Domain of unknown function (DUF4167)
MRNGQNKQRMRNRNNNNNRRGQNPMTRVYESNGPDIKIRGTASHIAEKYLQLARDARSSGDPVAAENYYQHAEHYFRLIATAQEQFRQNQQQPRGDEQVSDDGDDDGENYSSFGQEPGFVPQPQQQQPQPYMRDRDHQRDNQQQPYQRDQQQPREHRNEREQRPQPQYQPQPQNQPQPVVADAGSVDRLPSFITGTQPQSNGGQSGFEGGGGGERYPRRRRRPHGPRPDREAAPAASSDDIAPGE